MCPNYDGCPGRGGRPVTDDVAGSPRDIAAPTDDERLMMIAMEPGATKRPSVWHIHVIRTSEVAVDGTPDW